MWLFWILSILSIKCRGASEEPVFQPCCDPIERLFTPTTVLPVSAPAADWSPSVDEILQWYTIGLEECKAFLQYENATITRPYKQPYTEFQRESTASQKACNIPSSPSSTL